MILWWIMYMGCIIGTVAIVWKIIRLRKTK